MAIGAAIVGVIGALVAGGTAIYSGAKQNEARAQAGAEAKELYEQQEATRRKERREEMIMSQKRLGLEEKAAQQNWLTFIENKKNYREQMNKAALDSAGNTMSEAFTKNMAFRQHVMNLYGRR